MCAVKHRSFYRRSKKVQTRALSMEDFLITVRGRQIMQDFFFLGENLS